MAVKQRLIKLIRKNKKLFLVAKALRFLQTSSFSKVDGTNKKYPKVIQLPITYNCNSKCVMCNIWKMDHSNEMTVEEFATFMKDNIFKEVEAVGINGGEPSLVSNLPEYIKEVLNLPKLKSLNIISHGFSQKPLLKSLEEIYRMCKEKNIHFQVLISLDGVREIHNIVRGKTNVFEKTSSTIDEIMKNKSKYCDDLELGCTIVKQNIHNLIELDTYAKMKNYNIKFRLGIENKRIESDKLKDQYSVIYSPLKQSAKEFFHYQMAQTKDFANRFKYYAIFSWLNSEKPKRILGCMWKEEGITLDARGELYYCAVASNRLGSLRKEKGEKIFFDDKNIEYRKNIINNSCDGCIHDYTGKAEFKNVWKFLVDTLKDKLAMKIYKIKIRFL
ncbi:radical SAM protein [Aliarcobacter cryaerophilus]|uniref:radical SAM protein n=1 Tax=Aliarcobacter cryaerophilus TaxID=28198 RepID=UPI0021B5EF2D|nr:radical SAM protein [Aliarcobacter cryaerophilus]MCT7520527.1 radical SAM protein [Aliarcobacter cryaerophilus]